MNERGRHGCSAYGGLLSMDMGRIRIGTKNIAAVEMCPLVVMGPDARVKVHLVGGQTITVFYGQQGDVGAQEVADFVAGIMPGHH